MVDAYPFQLSGGMRQRVGIAAALARDPELLIADEPSTALDVTTQRSILARLRELQAARGMGLVLITHDLRVAFSMCDRIEVLYAGRVLERSPATELGTEPPASAVAQMIDQLTTDRHATLGGVMVKRAWHQRDPLTQVDAWRFEREPPRRT